MFAEKVLVTTDFSDPAKQLLHCVQEFACLGTKEIVLVHVVDIRTAGLSTSAFHYYDEEKLSQEKQRLESIGLQVKTLVPVGVPAPEIVKAARQEKVSLIIIASHGEGFIRQVFLGSTVFDVVRISDIPVYLEKFEHVDQEICSPVCENRLEKILLPLDFSECYRAGVELVKEIGHRVKETVLVSVIEKSRNQQELAQSKEQLKKKLDLMEDELARAGFRVTTRIATGVASRNILQSAAEEKVTMIILPKRGAGTIRELLLGATAEAVARHSHHPVLLIPCRREQ